MSLAGHSDADVGLHALTDAVLGAIGAGDIGMHFPPSDPRWRGAALRPVSEPRRRPRSGPRRRSHRGRCHGHLRAAEDRLRIARRWSSASRGSSASPPIALSVKATTTEKLRLHRPRTRALRRRRLRPSACRLNSGAYGVRN